MNAILYLSTNGIFLQIYGLWQVINLFFAVGQLKIPHAFGLLSSFEVTSLSIIN
jgi:hypothetical protein